MKIISEAVVVAAVVAIHFCAVVVAAFEETLKIYEKTGIVVQAD